MRRVEALCIIHYTKAGMVRETALEQKISGARSRTRTGTLVKARDFKSLVSTYFTIRAFVLVLPPGIEPGSCPLQGPAMTTSAKVALS